MKKIALFFIVVSSLIFAQTGNELTTYKLERLTRIYRSLEYNTTSFNDLKRTWIVTDPVFIRDIFNKFIVKNALLLHGKRPTLKDVEEMSEYIYNSEVFIDLRKRYYDDEIEIVRFFKEPRNILTDTNTYFFDPIQDFVAIKEILGENTYTELKKQGYALNDLTKTFFDYKPAYDFDFRLHAFEPELMFWSATTMRRNKYLLSFIGRWGNDHITLPGWYHPDYFVGLKLNYVDSLESNREGYTYIGEVGLGVPTIRPDLGLDDKAIGGRRLEHTGTSFYFKFVGQPLEQLWEEMKGIELRLNGAFTIGTKKTADFNATAPYYIYSTRNYFDLFFSWNNLLHISDLGAFSAGGGFSTFDVKYYYVDPATPTISMKDTSISGFKYLLTGEAGLSNVGSLLSHKLFFQLNYSITEKMLFTGIHLDFMVSNSIGFDFRIITPIQLSGGGLPIYRSDTYFVFSPIIRINY